MNKRADLIAIKDVSYTFPGKQPVTAVREISFSIPKGKITAIIGESGSGKSTLLKLVGGLLPCESGEIRLGREKLQDPREMLIPGHKSIRMVSQSFEDLNTYATVWDNVASQLSNTNLKIKESRTEAVLGRLRIAHLRNQRINDLSGGEKQRVAIAVALINDPRVLLLDEPFNQVDAAFRELLQTDIIRLVNSTGLTVLMVSHDPAEVLSMADKLIVMEKGALVADGIPIELYDRPPNYYTARLLARINVLSPAQARGLGIPASPHSSKKKPSIGIHRHAIHAIPDKAGTFRVETRLFKGFYDELYLKKGTLLLHCIHTPPGQLQPGDRVSLSVDEHWEFTQ